MILLSMASEYFIQKYMHITIIITIKITQLPYLSLVEKNWLEHKIGLLHHRNEG